MKKYSVLFFLLATYSSTAFAQQKTVERAIVKSKTEITFPQNVNRNAGGDDDGNATIGGTGGGMESKSTVYFKGDLIKTFTESDFGNNTVIIDKKNKKTITLTESMGRKTGFYSTEEDEEAIRKNMQQRMDSIRQARGQSANNQNNTTTQKVEIVNTNETKKIAGYNCNKAIVKTTTRQGEVNETVVWYTPDFKMAAGYQLAGNTGGGFGRGMRGQRAGFSVTGLDKIDGFIMGYEVTRSNGFAMNMEVTKVELDTEINDKTFDIPKGYDIKPLKEMQGQFGRGSANRSAENN